VRKLIAIVLMLWCVPAVGADEKAVAAIDKLLDAFHDAASEADGAFYFSLFAEDAVFIGTDAAERWTVDEFRAFAEPYFSEGRGWTYARTERHVYVSIDGNTAWFDEMLWNEKYGTCRGTGVLVLNEDGWRIAQYSLTFPIPNELSAEFTARIKELEGGQ
jgi:ketosteroid isomerase-like protein